MVCTDGPTFNLTARAGTMETPDGNSSLMWSYSPTGGHFQTPGPVLCVNEGDTVTVNLHNELPDATSIVFPGQKGVSASGGTAGLFAREAAAGGDVSYTFTASTPGTYVYESGTDPSKQVEMGLASAIIVRPAGHPDWAYNDSKTKFSKEYLILLNDIDPELHSAVENSQPYDIRTLHNRYFTINGRAFPDTLHDNGVPWLENQPYGALVHVQPYDVNLNPDPVLIRMLNVGLDNHPFHPHGESLQFIAQDGRQIKAPSGNDAVTEHFGGDDPVRVDPGLPPELPRPGRLLAQQQGARDVPELPQPDLQGQQHVVQRQPVPGHRRHAAVRHGLAAEHLRRVLLPVAQPRAERVRQLRRRLRRHGDAAAGRSAHRLRHAGPHDADRQPGIRHADAADPGDHEHDHLAGRPGGARRDAGQHRLEHEQQPGSRPAGRTGTPPSTASRPRTCTT